MTEESKFDRAFKHVINVEGVLSTDPRDNGNWTGGRRGVGVLKGTKYGISAAAYPKLDIPNLTLNMARALYHRDYWRAVHADDLPYPWALAAFDMAVNQGVTASARTMQDAVGVLVDGVIGPKTLAAVQRADITMLARFYAKRLMLYVGYQTFGVHGLGWFTRAVRTLLEAR